MTPLGVDEVPGLECFDAQTPDGGRRTSACVHAHAGIYAGRDGYQRWLRARGYRHESPATGAELLARAFVVMHGDASFRIERAFSRAEGSIRIVEFDGGEGAQGRDRRRGRSIEITAEAAATEGPTDRMTELDAPTGEWITRFRDYLANRTRELTIFRHLSDFDTPDIHCFQAYEGEHIPPNDSGQSACLRGSDILALRSGVSQYLQARGFTPQRPVVDPGKLLTMITLFTGLYDQYQFSDVRTSIVGANLEIRAAAQPGYGRSGRHVTRVVTVAPDFTYRDEWVPFEGGGATPGAPPAQPTAPQHAITPPGQT